MPDGRSIVTNTTPLIALAAATGSLDILQVLYQRVIVPLEVQDELLAAGKSAVGVSEFEQAKWLECREAPVALTPFISNSLDRGEAAVIQTAISEKIGLVCIDESVGRRIARLNGLALTGSIGILIKARRRGYAVSMPQALDRMRRHGIWLSEGVISFALAQAD